MKMHPLIYVKANIPRFFLDEGFSRNMVSNL